MPTLKGTEVSLSSVRCFLYLVTSSRNVSIFHSAQVHTFWTDLLHNQAALLTVQTTQNGKLRLPWEELRVGLHGLGFP